MVTYQTIEEVGLGNEQPLSIAVSLAISFGATVLSVTRLETSEYHLVLDRELPAQIVEYASLTLI